LEVVAVGCGGVIALARCNVDVVVGPSVHARLEAALFELGLYTVCIPWRDAKRDVIQPCCARGALTFEIGIVQVASTNDDVSDFTDLKLVLTSFVVGRLPSQEVGVKRGRLFIIRDSKGEMIQPHGLPPGRIERQ
jgi:hypothetical protein